MADTAGALAASASGVLVAWRVEMPAMGKVSRTGRRRALITPQDDVAKVLMWPVRRQAMCISRAIPVAVPAMAPTALRRHP